MKKEELDLLFFGEAQHNNNSKETHDDHLFYFATSVTDQQKKNAEGIREKQFKMRSAAKAKPKARPKAKPKPKPKSKAENKDKLLSGIELFQLDAEKLGMAVVISPEMRRHVLDVVQHSNRNISVVVKGKTN